MSTDLTIHTEGRLVVALVGAGIIDYSKINAIVGKTVIGGEGTSQKRFLSSQFVGNLHRMVPVYFCINGPAVLIDRLGPSLFSMRQVDHKQGSDGSPDNITRTILGMGSVEEWRTCLAYSNKNNYDVVNEFAEEIYQGLKSIGFGPYLLEDYRRHEWHGRPIFTRV